jgi:homoserine kinase
MPARKNNGSSSVEVCLPASTSNLGAGFDCFGLALNLYLTIRASTDSNAQEECHVRTTGPRENAALPKNSTNLIYRAMAYAAKREQFTLPPVDLVVHNDIPLASGLGSSGAAIVGGIKLSGLLTGHEIADETIQNYATEFEGHPDNVAAALYGGFVINCVTGSGEVLSIKAEWPEDLQIVVVSPRSQLSTLSARAQLPRSVSRADAVHNVQRAALFASALKNRRYDLLWEAMRDRLHQPARESLVPGLHEALAMPRRAGLLGIALSGAGPSILALVEDQAKEIGQEIANCFEVYKINSTIRLLAADNLGCRVIQCETRFSY